QVEDFIRHLATAAPGDRPGVKLDPRRPQEGLRLAWEAAVKARLVPAELPLSTVSRLFAVYQANLSALASYRPKPYPGRAVLLRATPELSAAEWEALVLGGVEVRALAGAHFTLLRAPCVREVAREIEACITSIRGT
ncbi:MAG TPA: hypothetical protein VKY89_25085, partial [Thermoanaerobaculia bacterium]|nr:hypothetical protein [Thermoanaerobaculia bacterium]